MKIAPGVDAFTRRGFRGREVFPHQMVAFPKPYPDAYLDLERRGVSREQATAGRMVQINLYSDRLDGLPDALFTDPAVNWHGQQFGRKGLIAAAGLFIDGDAAYVTLLQSDLCQQIHRGSAALKRAASARLNNRFRYWNLMLVNAVLDFALDNSLATVHAPTAACILGVIRKPVDPDLFVRVYDTVGERYACRRETIGGAEYWTLPLATNADRVVRLAPAAASDLSRDASRPVICVCHDIEQDIDTAVDVAACRAALDRMLAVERDHVVSATYSVVGALFRDTVPAIAAAGTHSVAFHSFDHRPDDLGQLRRVRAVDLQVKGYRPPRSVITAELSDYGLAYWNFEWLLSSARSFGFAEPRLEHGIVKIPIHLDDYQLHIGVLSRAAWMERLQNAIRTRPFVAISLHDCYAREWLDWYPELLTTLAAAGTLRSADEVVNRVRFATAL